MNTDWQIEKRSDACLACRRSFADEETLHCRIHFEGDTPIRKDYCQPCWEALLQGGEKPASFFSYWQSRYKITPPPVKVEPVKKDVVETLLKKYIGSTSPDHLNLCYVLAVMLERKKILSQKDSFEGPEGNKMLVYEHAKTGETFVITDPHLKLGEIPVVQQQVKALLDAELENHLTRS